MTLALKLEVSSISGTGFGGLPTFGNRSISTVIRLRDGETNLLAGLIRDDERHVMSGVPGLSDLPFIGRLFANNRRETQETDIVLTLTPHIVRVLDLQESDLRAFRVGREGEGGAASSTCLSATPAAAGAGTAAAAGAAATTGHRPIFAPPVQTPPNPNNPK